MFGLTAFLLVGINFVFAVDHNIFRNCSQVEFCNKLRSRQPQEKYQLASVENLGETSAILKLSSSDGSQNLIVNITSLENNTFRLKVTDVASPRYELKDVLDGEPKTLPFTSTSTEDGVVTLITENNKVILTSSPLSINFLSDDSSVVKLNADRLIIDNDESSKAFAFGVQFLEAVQIYGIHEHADSIALQNTEPGGVEPYRLRNLDVPNYDTSSTMALYGAIPVLYGHGTSKTSGIFLHNAAEQWYDIKNTDSGSEAYILAESGTLDLFVFLGPTPADVVHQYVTLTGTAHLPQLWTLGYHQCRWNYDNQSDVKDVVANFDKYNFPLDAIWLDIEYTDGKRYFTWNPENFTDPIEMQQNISASTRHLVTIIDPHIKADENYAVYKGALDADLFVKNPDGSNFEGDCWPGLSSYMDFLNPEARSYYANWYSYEKFAGSTPTLGGIWNDMNEPSVFNDTAEKTMPGGVIHYGGVEHRDIHNIYGLLHTMSTHEGLMKRDNGTKRPFILTRSHFAGSQRYTAFWTGDNTAGWDYLAASYSECMNSNILGLVFCGADVGGFFGEPDVELLQRWYQAAAWTPFYRAHANLGTERREPYLFPEDVQEVIRNAIRLRYKHIPEWYTLFFEHTRNKDPVIRPLFYQYPTDVNVFKIDNQLLLGSNILVRAVTEPGVESVQVYFPGGSEELWFAESNAEIHVGGANENIPVDIKSIPVYYRAGSIVIRKDTVRRSTEDTLIDGHILYVNLDKNNHAHGTVYLDDNTSFNYKINREYLYANITADGHALSMESIDESNFANIYFRIEGIVYNEISELPKEGKPGVYKQTVFKADSNNKLFKNQIFDFKEKITIQLPTLA